MTLFEFTILEHNFGIGISWDWTLLYHALIYGGTVPVVAFIYAHVFIVKHFTYHNSYRAGLRSGLVASITAFFYLEILQMWQYHWGCGIFGLADFAVSWGVAYVVYRILRR